MINNIVFIAGASHSGSTLLGSILGSNELNPHEYFHVGECHAFFTPAHPKFGYVGAAATQGGEISKVIDHRVSPGHAYEEIFNRSKRTNVIIDSSKNLSWLTLQHKRCTQKGFNLTILISYRPFERIWNSGSRRGTSLEKNLANLLYYKRLMDFLEAHNLEAVSVNMETIIKDPKAGSQSLCKASGIPYFHGKEQYWRFEHHHLYGASMQRRNISEENFNGFLSQPEPQRGLKELPYSSEQISDLERIYDSLMQRNA